MPGLAGPRGRKGRPGKSPSLLCLRGSEPARLTKEQDKLTPIFTISQVGQANLESLVILAGLEQSAALDARVRMALPVLRGRRSSFLVCAALLPEALSSHPLFNCCTLVLHEHYDGSRIEA